MTAKNGAKAGDPVPIWLGETEALAPEPITSEQAAMAGVAIALGLWATATAGLCALYLVVRALLNRSRSAAWQREWARVGPAWTRAARGATLELVTACAEEQRGVGHSVLRWAASLATQREPGLTVVTRVVEGPPVEVLCTAALGADVLVVGADDHGAFTEAIIGSVPGALLTTAPCPLVVVPRGAAVAPPEAPVLVGVDTADTAEVSRAVLGYAFPAADQAGRALIALSCWITPRDRDLRDAELVARQHALTSTVAGFAEQYRSVPVSECIVAGYPVEELTRRSRRAALLVLGSHGRGRLMSAAFGSVSRTLIRQCRCPVVVVTPDPVPANGLAS